MANPQTEDGYTRIANEIVEALAKTYFSTGECRVVWAVIRKTYGWHKKYDRISYSQLEELTGMNRRHIADALNRLIQRNIITRRGNNYKLEYGLQKDYESWETLPIEATNRIKHLKSLPIDTTKTIVTHRGNTPLPIEATKSLPIEANTKDKRYSTKDKTTAISFEEYKEELRKRFKDLDFDIEIEKFSLYWDEGKRKSKSPKLALLNWFNKAREIKEREVGGNGKNRQYSGDDKAGRAARIKGSITAPLH